MAGALVAQSARLSSITAHKTEKSGRSGSLEIVYQFDLDGDSLTMTVHVPPDGEADSLTAHFANADWAERDMAALSGIRLKGRTGAAPDSGASSGKVGWTVEHLPVMRNIHQNIILTERLCSLSSNSHPFSYCMALECIGGITLPERAEYLRVVVDEIQRIAAHLFDVAMTARLAGLPALFRQVLETREILQDAKEAIFGNRVNLAANCIGGVRYDLDDENKAYLRAKLASLQQPVAAIGKLCETNRAFLRRTRGVGVLPREQAIRFGVVGPAARASGIGYDVRRKAPYAVYDKLDFDVPTLSDGDVWSRTMIRLREVGDSVSLIEQALQGMPDGPIAIDSIPEIPAGEAIAKSESPRGELIYYLRTDGSDKPARLKWRMPNHNNWKDLQATMTGAKAADAVLIAGSIDPRLSCTGL